MSGSNLALAPSSRNHMQPQQPVQQLSLFNTEQNDKIFEFAALRSQLANINAEPAQADLKTKPKPDPLTISSQKPRRFSLSSPPQKPILRRFSLGSPASKHADSTGRSFRSPRKKPLTRRLSLIPNTHSSRHLYPPRLNPPPPPILRSRRAGSSKLQRFLGKLAPIDTSCRRTLLDRDMIPKRDHVSCSKGARFLYRSNVTISKRTAVPGVDAPLKKKRPSANTILGCLREHSLKMGKPIV